MSGSAEIQLIAVIVAAACALPGVFLVLRGVAMMSDAISHTVLLGIVLAFLAVGSVDSPLLLIGAAAMGVVTVILVEIVINTRLLKQDASIGIVFPFLFSIAVLLISRLAADVHLDNDAVLLGELALAPFDRLAVFGLDLPAALVTMGVILLANLVFIVLFYKELKLSTFDPGLAAALGFVPVALHYALMALVSITAVGAFDAVGSILVVALMVAPAAAAYLLTDRLPWMLGLAVGLGAVSAVGGYQMARALDANIAGSMATMTGIVFLLVLLLAPQRGMVAVARRRVRQRWQFAQTALAIHLLNHEGSPEAQVEAQIVNLVHHLRWEERFAADVVQRAERGGLVRRINGHLVLTDGGRILAQQAMSV